jgi:hypothetical protein
MESGRFANSPQFQQQLRDLLYRPGVDDSGYETLPITPQTPAADWELLSGASFDVKVPYVPGRSLEGVPNADTPEMREKIRRRLLLNPGGKEDLPGFLERAMIPASPLG